PAPSSSPSPSSNMPIGSSAPRSISSPLISSPIRASAISLGILRCLSGVILGAPLDDAEAFRDSVYGRGQARERQPHFDAAQQHSRQARQRGDELGRHLPARGRQRRRLGLGLAVAGVQALEKVSDL